jgi:hypothetical protein
MDSRGNLSEIMKILSRRDYYSSALVRAAISKEGATKLYGGYAILSERAGGLRRADYGRLVFVEVSLDKKEFTEWLTRMINEQVASFDDIEVPTKGDFDPPGQVPENFVPSDYGFFPAEWGCNFYRYRMNADVGSLPGVLPFRSELPLYPDSLLAQSTTGSKFSLDSTSRTSFCFFFLIWRLRLIRYH